ncbi:MAG TPA: amidohydrolase family protein [Candidatus Limnocylindria bacterium]|jgi:OH-DDVA meta-cleavage compound hydrolase|nr:amidohydrolase family protein [Candidatus Limnocylindria bacterium]
MVIDAHAHTSAPAELWAYKALLLSHRGAHGRGALSISDDQLIEAVHAREIAPVGHLESMKANGIDMQLISPRPFQMMQSEKPGKLVHWFTEEVNTIIHRQTQLFPDTFVGIAGLPQVAGEPIEKTFGELERCVKELGFKGCLLNPDPYENSGVEPPPLGDRYWYPLYEKLCELDVPAHIHCTGSRSERTPYTLHFINEESIAVYGLVNSEVFRDFPNLKIMVSHGGGAIPYQVGRFQSGSMRRKERFIDGMRKLYYDTVLYTSAAIKLLIDTVGADRCLFGAECPGVGSAINPETGRTFDDIVPYISAFDFLTPDEKAAILGGNARTLFNLPNPVAAH